MKKYRRNDKTITGRIDDELVMMDVDIGKYFALNPVATRIWELLDRPLPLQELCVLLTEEYEVDKEQCASETITYLEEMIRLGLISAST